MASTETRMINSQSKTRNFERLSYSSCIGDSPVSR
jgi:hypothetical protein